MLNHFSSRRARNLMVQVCGVYLLAICNICVGETEPGTAAAQVQVALPNSSDSQIVRETPVKSSRDTREYRYLQLPNHLQVLLVSDSSLTRSALGLNLFLGGMQDPAFVTGLPGWPAKLLDLPSDTYAQGQFREQIQAAGGLINVNVKANSSTYAIEVNAAQFAGVLAHLGKILKQPRVNSKFLNSLAPAGGLVWHKPGAQVREAELIADLFQLRYAAVEQSLQADTPAAKLTHYLQENFAPGAISLVVMAAQPLDDLEQAVVEQFADLPAKSAVSYGAAARINSAALPVSLEIKPEQEVRRLSFSFPVPIKSDTYSKKPYDYIAHLVSQKGQGSLLSFLKRLGWAQNVSAGLVRLNAHQGLFQIHLDLTRQGVKAREQLVPLVFYELEQVRSHGLTPWRYAELQTMADLQFQFADQYSPMRTVAELAFNLRNYQAADVLRNQWLFSGYDEKLIRRSLDRLAPGNLVLQLTAPEVQPLVLSSPSQVPYNLRYQLPPLLELKLAAKQALSLPEHNSLIPLRLAVKSSSLLEEPGNKQNFPQLIMENQSSRVWFAQDRLYKQPQALLAFNIKSPLVAASVAGAAQAQVFAALINDQLSEYAYYAGAAGIHYSFNASARGYELKLQGFSGRQSSLLNKIVNAIAQGAFTQERFAVIKEELLRKLHNRQQIPVPAQIAELVAQVQRDPSWSDAQIQQALQEMDFASFSRFVSHQLLDANMDMLVYGNYFRQEALKLAVLVEHELLDRQTGRGMTSEKFITLGMADGARRLPLQGSADSTWVGLWVPARSSAFDEMAHMLLAQQILAQQLKGDKAWAVDFEQSKYGAIPASPLASSLFVAQGLDSAAAMEELKLQLQAAADVEPQVRNLALNRLKTRLRLPHYGWQEKAEFYWAMICNHRGNFVLAEQIVGALDGFSAEAYQAFYQQVFLNPAHRLWLNGSAGEQADELPPIVNLEDFKRTQPGFFQP